jgi:hypothetical protein
MKALIFRAYQICTRKEDLEEEPGFFKTLLFLFALVFE